MILIPSEFRTIYSTAPSTSVSALSTSSTTISWVIGCCAYIWWALPSEMQLLNNFKWCQYIDESDLNHSYVLLRRKIVVKTKVLIDSRNNHNHYLNYWNSYEALVYALSLHEIFVWWNVSLTLHFCIGPYCFAHAESGLICTLEILFFEKIFGHFHLLMVNMENSLCCVGGTNAF
jgi:hypothetical protein